MKVISTIDREGEDLVCRCERRRSEPSVQTRSSRSRDRRSCSISGIGVADFKGHSPRTHVKKGDLIVVVDHGSSPKERNRWTGRIVGQDMLGC
jgi:hypothetical protein